MRYQSLRLLFLATVLQWGPFLRSTLPRLTFAPPTSAWIFQWITTVSIVSGGYHSLSGATSLTSESSITGEVGEPLSYQATLTTNDRGDYPYYRASGVSPTPNNLTTLGLAMDPDGALTGAPNKAGTFRIRISGFERANFSGYSASATITLVVNPPAPLAITTPPKGVSVNPGETATLTVEATGPGRTYQWFKGDTAIDGATEASYTIDFVETSHAGKYSVKITSGGQSISSTPVTLTVISSTTAPAIVGDLGVVKVHVGELLRLAPTTSGADPLTFAWSLSGIEIPSQTANVLETPSAQTADTGEYRLKVSNSEGVAEATIATVEVIPLSVSILLTVENMKVSWISIPGRTYFAESTDSLDPVNWQTVETVIADEASESTIISKSKTISFVRVRISP